MRSDPFFSSKVLIPAVVEMWNRPSDTNSRWEAWLHRQVRHCEEEVVVGMLGDTSGKVILDIGCGTGRYAHKLSYVKYYGMDPWNDVLIYARSWASELDNVSFSMRGVYDVWPVNDPDIVLTMNVFRHFSDPMVAYEYVYEKLEPGAMWITDFLTWNGGDICIRDISSMVPIDLMNRFLSDKRCSCLTQWFREIGDWWLVRIDK